MFRVITFIGVVWLHNVLPKNFLALFFLIPMASCGIKHVFTCLETKFNNTHLTFSPWSWCGPNVDDLHRCWTIPFKVFSVMYNFCEEPKPDA